MAAGRGGGGPARRDPVRRPLSPSGPCFLVGAELGGVPEPLIEQAQLVVRIPQWGLVPSLNLAVAGSIVVYDYLAKLHAAGRLDRPGGGLAAAPEPGAAAGEPGPRTLSRPRSAWPARCPCLSST